MLRSEQIMDRDLYCLSAKDTAEKALELLSERSLKVIPVVEDLTSKKYLGRISDRDILLKVFNQGKKPGSVCLEEIMNRNAVVCGAETPVNESLLIMLDSETFSLPVVDRQNSVVGILTAKHISSTHELKFTWQRLLESADSSIFESNFERNREAYERRIDMEVANILSMIDVLELKFRVESNGDDKKALYEVIFDEIDFLRRELENNYKAMKLSSENNWYALRDEFEVSRLKLNRRLYEYRKPISQLVESESALDTTKQ